MDSRVISCENFPMVAKELRARSYEALVAFDYVKKGWTLGAAVFQAMPRLGGLPAGEVADDVIRLAKESGVKIKKRDPREHYIVNNEGVTLSVYRGRVGAERAHRTTRKANMAGTHVAAGRSWAVEVWSAGHWTTVDGGLPRAVALSEARKLAARGERVSIAEYTQAEGSSAIGRIEVVAQRDEGISPGTRVRLTRVRHEKFRGLQGVVKRYFKGKGEVMVEVIDPNWPSRTTTYDAALVNVDVIG